jgi:protein OS-9
MATTDTIAFVKESKTCSYVLVVHTPRLCGEPGFMTKDAGEQASISCREVVAGDLPDRSDAAFLPSADHPLQKPRRKPVLPLPPTAAPGASLKDGGSSNMDDVLRKALDAFKGMGWSSGDLEMIDDGDGNIVIQFMEEVPLDGEGDIADQEAAEAAVRERFAAILHEANIKGAASAEKTKDKKKKGNGDEKQDASDAADRRREVDDLL